MTTNKPKFSISDKALLGMQPFTHFELLDRYGFTHMHFSYKWSSAQPVTDQELQTLQDALADTGIKVLDVHGPKPSSDAILSALDEDKRQLALSRTRRRLQITSALGGDAMVYHVPETDFSKAILSKFVESLKQLEEEARDLGVVIALENHYKLENDRRTFDACFEQFDPQYIGFTFDPGHASISKNFNWLLDNCMDRLKILHLNDNDGVHDNHWNPFQAGGTVDWETLAKAIAKSPYDKPLQLEVAWDKSKHETRKDFLANAQNAVQKLQSKVDEIN